MTELYAVPAPIRDGNAKFVVVRHDATPAGLVCRRPGACLPQEAYSDTK